MLVIAHESHNDRVGEKDHGQVDQRTLHRLVFVELLSDPPQLTGAHKPIGEPTQQ